ncbi:hypothetical protein MAPG_05828 [Magnaporthiopsis poae ATCC 64411]|uniref:Ureidoglycolate hydrolase n=1 Tax=Magnaporthiopsis poae (strain ATCC 64411 / 73-15) TaxID=644358 RepID=A0A0C4E0F5_MAGP6|nr:hypothetical protein MAPG_05828 [Magnaporthiopsis poae ATCC 64411]
MSENSVDARNKLEDLSGVVPRPGENPYNALIEACSGKPSEIQALYATHRTARNAQQREKFLSAEFHEVITDPILMRLEDPTLEPGFKDTRNSMVVWARPPEHVLQLAGHVQRMLKEVAPHLWLMPLHRMHMTTLEVTHSEPPEVVAALLDAVRPRTAAIVNHTYARSHRARLVKPMVPHDLAAVALSFVPAAGERGRAHDGDDDSYSYHHLRRDIFDITVGKGKGNGDGDGDGDGDRIEINSRYVVPSAHVTLARFLTQADHATTAQREAWVRRIDEVNAWLDAEVWDGRGDGDDGKGGFVGEWVVGQERGLDLRVGPLWYGGGRSVMVGEGF